MCDDSFSCEEKVRGDDECAMGCKTSEEGVPGEGGGGERGATDIETHAMRPDLRTL